MNLNSMKRRGGDCRLAILLVLVAIVCYAARAQAKFEIIALSDMENYVDPTSNAHIMVAQTQWVVDQRAAENIVFVSQLGDLLHYDHDVEIPLVNAAFDILDGEVPYSVSAGNHDFSQQFEDNFGETRYTGYDWYGGSHDIFNHYQIFSAEGYDFLHINLEKDASGGILTWAQGVVYANLGKPTIISTHDYLDNPGNVATRTGAGEDIWIGLVKDNPQIFMTLSGHKHRTPASAHMLSDNSAGEPVLQILADFEDYRSDSGETDSGYLSRVIFDPDAKKISVKTYSPTYEAVPWLTDSDHQYSFRAMFLTQVDGVASRPIGVVPEPATAGFQAWQITHFGNPPAAEAGPGLDPDFDGMANLLEYALGKDPHVSDQAAGNFEAGVITFTKGAAVTDDVTYTIVESDDLGVTDPWEDVDHPDVNDANEISYSLPLDKDALFVRLKVALEE
jgi:hypothetical protein